MWNVCTVESQQFRVVSKPGACAFASASASTAVSAVRMSNTWDAWLQASLSALSQQSLLRSLRPISPGCNGNGSWDGLGLQTFAGPGPWDRAAVEVEVSPATFQLWLRDDPSGGEEVLSLESVLELASGTSSQQPHKLLLFSGNDYLGLSSHPAVRDATAKAALEYGMGPRASSLVCGYTHHHRLLESALADLKHAEECLLCPTGFSANMAVITALASNILPENRGDVIGFFSDALNHASIIDGLRVAQRQSHVVVHVYRHNDVTHLDKLLSTSECTRKVVITDSLFSMDGDFAPLQELATLRKKHGFLLVIDEAHATLVCGDGGGGLAEALGVEHDVDIHVGTLSKAIGCQGGFIASSLKWKQWIQSRGRSFIFTTALSIPVVAAAHAALRVAREERWRQKALWDRVRQLSEALGIPIASPIAPIILEGSQETLFASRELLKAGFHVTAIRPPTVPPNTSRLRIALSAAHSAADVNSLVATLVPLVRNRLHSQAIGDLRGVKVHLDSLAKRRLTVVDGNPASKL